MKLSLNRISSRMFEVMLHSETSISLDNTKVVHELSRGIEKSFDTVQVVPTYNTVGVHFVTGEILVDELKEFIEGFTPSKVYTIQGNHHVVPTKYELTEDVKHMCNSIGIQPEELFHLHQEREYLVAMVGFKPNFPYLLGMNESIAFPRKATPTRRIEAGSVAIGGAQTGVYSRVSPGGWWVIGSCDPKLLNAINMGDTVKFERISK